MISTIGRNAALQKIVDRFRQLAKIDLRRVHSNFNHAVKVANSAPTIAASGNAGAL